MAAAFKIASKASPDAVAAFLVSGDTKRRARIKDASKAKLSRFNT